MASTFTSMLLPLLKSISEKHAVWNTKTTIEISGRFHISAKCYQQFLCGTSFRRQFSMSYYLLNKDFDAEISSRTVYFQNPNVLIRSSFSYMAHSAAHCRQCEDSRPHCTWMSSRFSRVLSGGPSTKHIAGSSLVGEKPK